MVSVHVYIKNSLIVTTQQAAGVVSLDVYYLVLLVEDVLKTSAALSALQQDLVGHMYMLSFL